VSRDLPRHTAIWAITPNGAGLARAIAARIDHSALFLPQKLATAGDGAIHFERLTPILLERFTQFSDHVFIMATGIVVRTIAARLVHKTTDPAVVVCDEAGRFAISLVSGHMGGANALARKVARLTGGQAVITTATDVNQVPAIDLIAVKQGLTIENPQAIKSVNMALLTGDPIGVHDPYGLVTALLPPHQCDPCPTAAFGVRRAGIFVDHMRLDLPPPVLILRPASLVAGVGCNRGTDVAEIRGLLEETLTDGGLAMASLRALATVDLKADESGLLTLAESLNLPLKLFSRDQLGQVAKVPTPSAMVRKHIGVESVCEAAALLATHRGRLLIPKRKTANVTVAIAADGYSSSASVPAGRST
jgi:cobalt-precorrin 5A hydrolase